MHALGCYTCMDTSYPPLPKHRPCFFHREGAVDRFTPVRLIFLFVPRVAFFQGFGRCYRTFSRGLGGETALFVIPRRLDRWGVPLCIYPPVNCKVKLLSLSLCVSGEAVAKHTWQLLSYPHIGSWSARSLFWIRICSGSTPMTTKMWSKYVQLILAQFWNQNSNIFAFGTKLNSNLCQIVRWVCLWQLYGLVW